MTTSKYEKYFITDCVHPKPEKFGPAASDTFTIEGALKKFPESKMTGSGQFFIKPFTMVTTTHLHDFDEWLIFMGSNFMDISEFDAVIELYMGEEGEKCLITKPTVVYIPKGLVHCPLNFAVINKPVFFFHPRYPSELKNRRFYLFLL